MLKVKFWGVRGSIPTSGDDKVYFGGNTSCIEVRADDQLFIFDCGTGLRALGNELLKTPPVFGKIFISHLHWDHIQGFPFFTPAMIPGNRFEVYAPPNGRHNIKEILEYQMREPNFPVPLSLMTSNLAFHDVDENSIFTFGNVTIRTFRLNHPGGCFAYRLEHNDFSMVFATDNEHYPDRVDEKLVNFIRDSNLFIYDAQYSPEEYLGLDGTLSKKGWGHSTMMHAARLAEEGNVGLLTLFHHDPNHSDKRIFEIEKEARNHFPSTLAAFDGMTVMKKAGEMNLTVSEREVSNIAPVATQDKASSLRKLIEVSMEISGEDDLDNLLQLIVEKSIDLTSSDGASIYLKEVEPETGKNMLAFKAALNQSIEVPKSFKLDINAESVAGYVAMTGNIVQIDNAYKMHESTPFRFNPVIDRKYGYKTVSMLVLPITNYKKEVIGVIQLVNRKKDSHGKVSRETRFQDILPYDTDSEDLLKSLSVLAGGALEKIMMIYELKGAMKRIEETQSMLIQQEKLASLGTMAAGLAHELNQPLTNIQLLSTILIDKAKKEKLEKSEMEEKLNQVEQQCHRMQNLINHLRTFSRRGPVKVNLQSVDLQETLESALLLMRSNLVNNNIKLQIEPLDNLPLVKGDPLQLEQVFINIINNARDALKEAPEEKRKLVVAFHGYGSMAGISFTDTGKGMSEETLNKVFTPFFTTKGVGEGTGIGLFICHGIIENHGGSIEVASEKGKGTRFLVKLPTCTTH